MMGHPENRSSNSLPVSLVSGKDEQSELLLVTVAHDILIRSIHRTIAKGLMALPTSHDLQ
jgi:hypothetical protein